MSKKRMKSVAIMLSVSILLSCMGCASNQENKDTKDMVYEETLLSLDDMEGDIGAIAYKDDRIYFFVYQSMESLVHEDNEEGCEIVTKLYSVNMDGSDLKEVPYNITKPGEILHIMVGNDDTINFVMDYYDEETEQNATLLVKIDKDGEELININLAEVIKIEEDIYLNDVVMDSNGCVVAITEQAAYILNDEFEMVGEVKTEDYITGVAVGKDGEIICATSGAFLDDDGSAQVRVLDVDNKKWGKKYKIKTGGYSGSNCIMDGYEYDFYYRDDSGIYGYDIEKKLGVKLMDYAASYLTGERANNMISVAGGKFVCNIVDLSEESSGIAVYTKVDPATIQDKVTITYGGLFIDESVKKAAIDFNRTNKEYQIEFIDYSSETEDPISKMNADIIAGNIPDIIDLNYLSVEQYVNKGLLEDLSSYVEKDSEISSEDFMESPWEAMHINNRLYYVVSSFGIDTIIGKTKDVGKETGWTFDELKEELEKHGNDVRAFYSENKADLLSLFLRNGLMDFIDWESGECQFNSQEFKEILEFCNDRGTDKETDYTEYRIQMSSLVKDGKQLFVDAPGLTIEEIQLYQEMFGEDISFIGYPSEERTGSYFRFKNRIGISAKSEAKEAAWAFVRTFLTKEYQGKIGNIVFGTPTRKDCFEMLIKRKTTTEEYIDELGQEIYPVSEYWEWDGVSVEGRPLSQQEADMYIDLVNNTKKSNISDSTIMQIVTEEAEIYFKGDKSLDEVVEVIQNRVQTYVDESR